MRIAIYRITNRITGKEYVGITRNPDARFRAHCQNKNSYVGNAILKYGKDNFDFVVSFFVSSYEEAYRYEKHLIEQCRTLVPDGYNLTDGGYGGGLSDETKLKISSKLTGHTVSAVTRAKISKAFKGKGSGRKNYRHSEETKKKMSDAKIGKTSNNKGKKMSAEQKQKISESLKLYNRKA